MGQAVAVTEKKTATPGVVRFELNRSLTGMGHERYRSIDDVKDTRPPDVLARLLFEHGGVNEVHIYSNVATVHLASGGSTEGMADLIRSMYIHYKPGVQPTIVG
jgi:hypothetical protein